MKVLPFYTVFLACFFVLLSVRAIRARRRTRIAIGDAGNPELARAIGVHANFAEYTPMVLFLLLLAELKGAPIWLMHVWGCLFCLGRVVHAYGVSQAQENFRFRVFGMAMTFTTISTAALVLLYLSISA